MKHVLTIPDWSRQAVRSRARDRCEMCGSPAPMGHWHHRRSRSVRDIHTHCPCNGAWLCGTCHRIVHENPMTARLNGFIVSRSAMPNDVPLRTPWGDRINTCNGGYTIEGERA